MLDLTELLQELINIVRAGDDEGLFRFAESNGETLANQSPANGCQKLTADRHYARHDIHIIMANHAEFAIEKQIRHTKGQKLRKNSFCNGIICNFKRTEKIAERYIYDGIENQSDRISDAVCFTEKSWTVILEQSHGKKAEYQRKDCEFHDHRKREFSIVHLCFTHLIL